MVYFLIGMHRSGTSLVSNLLHSAGIHMYDQVRLPDKWNPGGYGEDEEFKAINKAILHDAGGWWAQPPMPEEIRTAARKHIPDLQRLIKDRDERFDKWGLKDPRMCLLAQYYPTPARVVLVTRNTEDIVKSLKKREQEKQRFIQSDAFWTVLVTRYLAAAYNYVGGAGQKVHIDYDKLTSYHTINSEVKKLESFLERDIDFSKIRIRKEI